MNNKKTFTVVGLIAVNLIALTVFLAQARAAVTVYADEPASNAASAVETNASATQTNSSANSRSRGGNPEVQIDDTGIHIGGPEPLDIQMPRGLAGYAVAGAHLVKIIAIVSPFIMVVAIIALAGYFAHRRNKITHETIRAMIDKGVPMTPELVAELRSSRPHGSRSYGSGSGRLLPGLVCIGVGTALLIAGHAESRGGLIVLFIGLAFLITWVVEQKSSGNAQPP